MNNGNMFFEQKGRKMYGNQFGYALEYEIKRETFGITRLKFVGSLIMPDDPQNWKRPLPINLATECIFELVKKEKGVLVNLYGVCAGFSNQHTMEDIRTAIYEIQLSQIKINSNLPIDVKHYMERGIKELIKGMPIV